MALDEQERGLCQRHMEAQDLEISPPNALFDLDPGPDLPSIELTPGGDGFLTISLDNPGQGGEVIDEIIVVENFFLEIERAFSDQNK